MKEERERERETHTEDWRESEETGGQADGCGLHPGRFLSARSVQWQAAEEEVKYYYFTGTCEGGWSFLFAEEGQMKLRPQCDDDPVGGSLLSCLKLLEAPRSSDIAKKTTIY